MYIYHIYNNHFIIYINCLTILKSHFKLEKVTHLYQLTEP